MVDTAVYSTPINTRKALEQLLATPSLVKTANEFTQSTPLPLYTQPSDSKSASDGRPLAVLYVAQRECAVVSGEDGLEWVGSGDATTCVILILRSSLTGRIACAHFDSEKQIVLSSSANTTATATASAASAKQKTHNPNCSLTGLLDSFTAAERAQPFDTHVIGGYNDSKQPTASNSDSSQSLSVSESLKTSVALLSGLESRSDMQFRLVTACVWTLNTKYVTLTTTATASASGRKSSAGSAGAGTTTATGTGKSSLPVEPYPLARDAAINMKTGRLCIPQFVLLSNGSAEILIDNRGPNYVLRCARIIASDESTLLHIWRSKPNTGSKSESGESKTKQTDSGGTAPNTDTDKDFGSVVIPAFTYRCYPTFAQMKDWSDQMILTNLSTSPLTESPLFAIDMRSVMKWLVQTYPKSVFGTSKLLEWRRDRTSGEWIPVPVPVTSTTAATPLTLASAANKS